jgi:hypothetical protein
VILLTKIYINEEKIICSCNIMHLCGSKIGGKANNIAHVRYVICSNVTYIEGFRLNQLTKTPLRIGASKSCALLTTLEEMSWILFLDSVTRNRYTKTFQNSEYLTTGQKDNS